MKYPRAMLTLAVAFCATTSHATTFQANFPSGSIGEVTRLDADGLQWQLALRDDNDNAALPHKFRAWWYVRANDVSVTKPMTLAFTRIGWNYEFRPVYSYDNKRWHYFEDGEARFEPGCRIAEPDTCRMTITKAFERPVVWIARTFPYTYADLRAYLRKFTFSPYVKRVGIGKSPILGKTVPVVRIASPRQGQRQRIVIHARTHAAETGPSYVVEGLMNALTRNDALGQRLRDRYVFDIVPMHNIDGVQLGNYRTNGSSLNLENRWFMDKAVAFPISLLPEAPEENQQLNRAVFAPAVSDQETPTVLALNLHASNSAPNTQAFFFPHFGSDPARYSSEQSALWRKQLSFIRAVASHYDGRIEQPPADGGAGFLNSAFVESWWWHHQQEQVNAITLETTYGRAGFDHWITQDDLRRLGEALALAIDGMDRPHSRSVRSLDDPARANDVFREPFKPEIYENEAEH